MNLYLKRTIAVAATLAIGIAGTLTVQRVRAAGIPASGTLTYTGQLALLDGTPVNGDKNIGLIVFDAQSAGNRVCDVISSSIKVVAGRFQIALPDTCVAAVKASPDLWVDVQIDGGSIGRTKLGAVPYAIEADRASNAVGPLNTRIGTLETAKGTLGGNAKAGYYQPPDWTTNYLGVAGVIWHTLWSTPITVPVNSVVNISLNGAWHVDTAWCYLAVAIDGVSLADATCGGGTTHCWGATHTYGTNWAPIGYSAASNIAAGNHTFDIQVMTSPGTTCSVGVARLYWTIVPQ